MRDRQPQTALYVGIDVSKATLTIALYPTAQVWDIPNQPDQWQALAAQLQKPPVQRVLLESSGGYEQGVAQTLQQAGLPVMVVPAQRARHFAKSMRGDLKTDRVDAQLLAYFACCYPAPEATAVPEGQAQLRALWARREQLVQMLEAEKKRRQGAPETVRASLERLIAVLEEEIAQIEAEVAALIEADAPLSQKAALLQTAVGVGAVVAYGLLAELPELGTGVAQGDCGVSGLSACASGERSLAWLCADRRGSLAGASVVVSGGGGSGVARCALVGGVCGVACAREAEEGGVMCGGASVIGGVEGDGARWEGV
jgi:transposase